MTSDRFREWDAAYLLGALSPEDRHAFERHLPTCPACAVAVAELAGLPGILAALPAAEAVALTETTPTEIAASAPLSDAHLRAAPHQPGAVQRLAGAAVARTRRNRLRLAVAGTAVAAGLALGGGFLGATLGTPATLEAAPHSSAPSATAPPTPADPAPTMVVAMEPVEDDALTAALTITDTDWGTRFDWSCVYLNQLWKDNGPQDYDMVMTDQDGTATVLATWTATSPSTENLAASTDVTLDQIRSVEIRASLSGLPLAHTDL
ncbi:MULTISPECIES: anti-sigma factor [unclassified Cryobacterium]|uniref:anti-sigma factor family protein n=1 Tax=unclassified Cryobacterium TaxID=2649013 RepID=UPI00106A437B|nr:MULTISPECIES: zf-HC2 domain-containing protein [unclassified Cryobacterium]TFC51022.1 zf-HC2 domain-containing protein [Cryobacterium sp. TMB3-1-2]TFC74368.1 zf-HC2 domain-containing protein [Cryobacterium sp. TMB3-15]TFC79881.1 zf-HC2 domain-containing protein [Cryobacterium sp. TMB3-10]